MNCADVREELHDRLNRGATQGSAAALSHMEACAPCRAYAEEMTLLDSALRRLPRASVPPRLAGALAAIGEREAPRAVKIGWGPEIRRAAAVLLPVAFAWGINAAPPNALLIFAGTCALSISILRPLFLSPLAPRPTIE